MKIKNNAKRRSTKRMPVLSNSTPFAVKESYMDLCTNLMFSVNSKGEHSKVFVITSTVESEDKSTVAANTAVGLAMLGKKGSFGGFGHAPSGSKQNMGFP